MGVLDLLPLVGATIAAVIVGIETLFYSFPVATIIWATVAVSYQLVENHVISPIVYRLDLGDAKSYPLAREFRVRDKDIIFVANAEGRTSPRIGHVVVAVSLAVDYEPPVEEQTLDAIPPGGAPKTLSLFATFREPGLRWTRQRRA